MMYVRTFTGWMMPCNFTTLLPGACPGFQKTRLTLACYLRLWLFFLPKSSLPTPFSWMNPSSPTDTTALWGPVEWSLFNTLLPWFLSAFFRGFTNTPRCGDWLWAHIILLWLYTFFLKLILSAPTPPYKFLFHTDFIFLFVFWAVLEL